MKVYGIQEVHNEPQPHECIGGCELFLSKAKRDEELLKKKSNEYYDFYAFEAELDETQ